MQLALSRKVTSG